jgi:FMN-dependent NADH-azoreductase
MWLIHLNPEITMTRQLLHIDSSISGGRSVSRSLSASVVARLTHADPDLQVTYRDLAAEPVPHLSGAYLAAAQSGQAEFGPTMQADLTIGRAVLAEFLAADIVVLGLGFYNFGIPSQLKAWVDRLAVAGKTFQYTDKGPVGLVGSKRVIIAIARGGFYGPGTPTASYEHAETYLRGVFGFFGIPEVEVVVAEGLNVGPEVRHAGIAKAEARIAELHA